MGYPKNLVLNIHFNQSKKGQYLLTAIIRLKQGTVLIKKAGDDTEAIIYALFDRLKLALTKNLHKYRKEHIRQKRKINYRSFNDNLPELIGLKDDGSEALLKDLLKVLLNDLARYIRRRLKTAELTFEFEKKHFDRIENIVENEYKSLSISSKITEKKKKMTLYIEPDKLHKYGLFDVSRGKEMIKIGYDKTIKVLTEKYNSKKYA